MKFRAIRTQILQVSAYEIACDQCDLECEGCTMMNPNKALLCEPTFPNTDSPTADGTLESLNLAPGYWRSSNLSRDIRACPRAKSCPGGTEGRCAIGYDRTCECGDIIVMVGRCGLLCHEG